LRAVAPPSLPVMCFQKNLPGSADAMATAGNCSPAKASQGARPHGDGDHAAGVSRHISLSEPGLLASFCCKLPAVCLFGMVFCLIWMALFCEQSVFYIAMAVLTVYVFSWTINMAVMGAIGAWRMRAAASEDWTGKLARLQAEDPEGSEVMHIVILPNYKEDEDMLCETLENIAKSSLARRHIRIVLGMEGREGDEAVAKADRLIQKNAHLFADLFAAYHPAGRPGEIPGKSSNTQWAYNSALARYAGDLAKHDPSCVYVSVGDADTLWNPQYFCALAYQGLTMNKEDRMWAIWQPPVLLLRNIFSVPAFTRLAGFGAILFELAGPVNQGIFFGKHLCYSSYSMTLALASHSFVNGWDTDVIAEDHHMFCKCFFGALWESAASNDPITQKVKLCPVYLPAEGYLVESDEGYIDSCKARFQQARRHAQGVAELGYVIMQYVRLMMAVGPMNLPLSTHIGILAIAQKMVTVHIINNVQACALVLTVVISVPPLLSWVWASGGLFEAAQSSLRGTSFFGATQWALVAAFGPAPPVGIISAATIFIVCRDVVEGRYLQSASKDSLAKQADEDCCGGLPTKSTPTARPMIDCGVEIPGKPGRRSLSTWEKVCMAAKMQHDMFALAEPTIILYGMTPTILAVSSLFRRGPQFEYIVAAKPK